MEGLERFLVENPFFKGMKKEYLELLVGCASNVRFDAGEFIVARHNPKRTRSSAYSRVR
jgi:hypothetical protein